MKLSLALSSFLPVALAALRKESLPENKRRIRANGGKGKKDVSFQPGNFDWGRLLKDKYGRRYLVANGLTGRVLAYTGEPVTFADGTTSTEAYHTRADGGAVFEREDGMGWIYVSNDENGSDSDIPTSLTGGVYALKLNEDHYPVDYYQILSGTADNCAGGRTPWGTWVSCEEESGYGLCWQTDPEGVIPGEVTAVVQYGSNWEGFAWDDDGLKGYTTDDLNDGPLARFTPDAAALACYYKETKSERWCTLNSGTVDYLKLVPNSEASGCGTVEWVANPADANPDLYRSGEGADVTDGILTFSAKRDHLWFEVDLEKDTYCQHSTLQGFKQQPDNLRVFDDVVYFCTDSGAPNGIFGYDGEGWFGMVMALDFGSEAAGVDFTSDGMYMYMPFQTEVTMVFWREDGKPFDYKNAGITYINDSNNVYFKDGSIVSA